MEVDDSNGAGPARQPRKRRRVSSKSKAASKEELGDLLGNLQKLDAEQYFAWPVSAVDAPGYHQYISYPMDFATMRKKLAAGIYSSITEIKKDFVVMCKNATTYNEKGSEVHQSAARLLAAGQELIKDWRALSLKLAQEAKEKELEGKIVKQRDGVAPRIHYTRMDARKKSSLAFGNQLGEKQSALAETLGKISRPTSRPIETTPLTVPWQEKTWKDACIATDLNYGTAVSFGPTYDGFKASVSLDDAELIHQSLNPEDGARRQEVPSLAGQMDHLLSTVRRMGRRRGGGSRTATGKDPAAGQTPTAVNAAPSTGPAVNATPTLTAVQLPPETADDNPAVQYLLDQNAARLLSLHREQMVRLSAAKPDPTKHEVELAAQSLMGITKVVAGSKPRGLASSHAIMSAMGITLQEPKPTRGRGKGAANGTSAPHSTKAAQPPATTPTPSPAAGAQPGAKPSEEETSTQPQEDGMEGPPPIIHCANCQAESPAWILPLDSVCRPMCYACGQYYHNTRRLRPVLFGSLDSDQAAAKLLESLS